jgi:hypothetical protein
MRRIEEIERQIAELSDREFAELRDWIEHRDAQRWDTQLEEDVAAGRLDALMEAALRDHAAGRTTEL